MEAIIFFFEWILPLILLCGTIYLGTHIGSANIWSGRDNIE